MSDSRSPPNRPRPLRLAGPLLLALFAVLPCTGPVEARLAAETPQVILPWTNGGIFNIGMNLACLSDPPFQEIRVQGYAGYSLRPPNFTPAVGETFYAHLVLGHPGNPCTGSAVGIELLLPTGVVTAVGPDHPVFCFARLPPTQTRPFPLLIDFASEPDYGCPQTFSQGIEGLRISPPLGGLGGGWGMHRGFFIELLVPLRATQPQAGNTTIRFRVNPDIGVVERPSVPLLVNNEVIFRSAMEDDQLTLDICTVSPAASGC